MKTGKRLGALAAGFITSLFSKLIGRAPTYKGCGGIKQFSENLQLDSSKTDSVCKAQRRGLGSAAGGDPFRATVDSPPRTTQDGGGRTKAGDWTPESEP